MKNYLITEFEGIGPKKADLLAKLGIVDSVSLLTYFPTGYEDRTEYETIYAGVSNEKSIQVKIKVTGFDRIKTRGRGPDILKVNITDGETNAALVCYNRYYLKDTLKKDTEYIVIGKFEFKYNEFQCSNFEIEIPGENVFNYGRIVPVYALTKGITQKLLRKLVFDALKTCINESSESLPCYILKKRVLASRIFAIKNIHFPENENAINKARQRLIYYEFFEMHLSLAIKKKYINTKNKNRKLKKTDIISKTQGALDFDLTGDQVRALCDVLKDIHADNPMSRLLLGDVGCGKTVVAVLPALIFLENGYQVAFMAPTEILANQHYKTVSDLLKIPRYNIHLLSGSMTAKEKQRVSHALNSGEIHFVIGTHALFQDLINFKDLAYVIIDEQHRFGVKQRLELMKKAKNPDVLYLSATPIPRSLALTLYGDLDISVIKEKPANRIPVKTTVIQESDLKQTFDFIKEQTQKGQKAYIVYPLIEDSDKIELKAAATEYDKVKNSYFKNVNCGLIHGRMNVREREETMQGFINGSISVLFSTTVIEVGVDVPEATVMLIENAHRYGLSTLHQLRGRIGRGNEQSYCFLVLPKNTTENAVKRVRIMEKTNDGFEISQKDLEMRGPGEFLGTRQHGILPFRLASLTQDKELFFKAREDVENVMQSDPELKRRENLILKNTVYKNFMQKYKALLRS